MPANSRWDLIRALKGYILLRMNVLVFHIDSKASLRHTQSPAGMHCHVRTQHYNRLVNHDYAYYRCPQVADTVNKP